MKIFNANAGAGEKNWSMVELLILRENYEAMDDKELATVIGVTASAVKAMRQKLSLLRPLLEKLPKPPKERSLTEQQIQKRNDRSIKERKLEEERKRRNEQHAISMASKMRLDRRVFKNRQQDLSQMRTVRIDSKTWLYVKPNDDVEKLKKQYQRTLSKEGYSKIEW